MANPKDLAPLSSIGASAAATTPSLSYSAMAVMAIGIRGPEAPGQ